MIINKDSKYNVAIITTHGTLNEGHMRKHLLCVYCFFFLIIERSARYACGLLATTTA